jgi:hypothetical protein
MEIVEVMNKHTGARGSIRRDWFENPAINAGVLEEVDASQKPYVSELYRSRMEPTHLPGPTIDPEPEAAEKKEED